MKRTKSRITQLLPRGAVKEIATTVGLSGPAVSIALRSANPAHPAVQEALRIIDKSNALATAQKLATLTSAAAD
ncbi:hypothetical protein GCM10023172_27570 [Hymenobacter ginsengisoli]|uniref:LacI family transcriptional regulator n=1 Tax=Hymenobacter ginsengisoli TaxID=1051626 RepID=A0ABP8QGU4_9BACT